MRFDDFEYDGILLSDFDMIIGTLDSSDSEVITNGAELTFNTVSAQGGEKNYFIQSVYEESASCQFQIFKNPCKSEDMFLSDEELSDLMMWLNRRQYHDLQFVLDGEPSGIHYSVSFNTSRIEVNGKPIGLELSALSSTPFGSGDEVIIKRNLSAGQSFVVQNLSEEEGYLYPIVEFKPSTSGELKIENTRDHRVTVVKNCVKQETIVFNYPMINTSLSTHKIQNDFNWSFPRLFCAYEDLDNRFTFSLAGAVTIKYTPTIKVGM